MKYIVEKRIINNYLVEVEADNPENAIHKAVDNEIVEVKRETLTFLD